MTLHSRRSVLLLGVIAALAACTPAGPPSTTTSPGQLTTASILAAINGVRRANGRKPLKYNHRLEQAARTQAEAMARADRLSHDLGTTLRQRVFAAGYDGAVGENVAGGQRTLEAAIQGWLDSPPHRSTLLSDRFTEFGLAVASAPAGRGGFGTYWAFVAGGSVEAWIGA